MIELRNLTKEYDQGAVPLQQVNAVINDGDVIAVIGPSGAGKSTFLRCLNRLEEITEGQIILDGVDITAEDCDLNLMRRKMGMVFQSFNLYNHLTVVENCMLAQTMLLERPRQEAYDKAMELLAYVGMDEYAMLYPEQLSGGQKQRVAIARTLSMDPEVILFDEPTSALDPVTAGEVEDIISRLAEQGRTMVIVTHNMDFARDVSTRVFYLDQGGIYEEGTPEQIFSYPQKEKTRRFIHKLSTLELEFTLATHNYMEEVGMIFNFCSSKKLSSAKVAAICSVYEEISNLMADHVVEQQEVARINLEYQEKQNRLTFYASADGFTTTDYQNVDLTVTPEYKALEEKAKSVLLSKISGSDALLLTIEVEEGIN